MPARTFWPNDSENRKCREIFSTAFSYLCLFFFLFAKKETVAFLDDLAYSSNITPGVLVMREKYQATLARSWAGGCERPAKWRESFEEENVQPSESKDRPSAMNHHTRPQNDT